MRRGLIRLAMLASTVLVAGPAFGLFGDDDFPLSNYPAIAAHPWLHTPIALMTLVLELGAPLAVLTVFEGRLRRAWVFGLWSMHLGILAVMAIGFLYPLSGAAYACFFAVEVPMARVLARIRRDRPPADPTSVRA